MRCLYARLEAGRIAIIERVKDEKRLYVWLNRVVDHEMP